jgi:cytochrome c biogenesis protein CcmG, thiol:disulfide interchange protein DsbE
MKTSKVVMRPVYRRILFLAILLLGFAWTVLSRPAEGSAGAIMAGRIPAPQVGFLASPFTLTELTGKTIQLSDYQDQVVVLNFWASWCPPCRVEMPAIQQLYQTYQSQGLVVLAINTSYQDLPADMQTFIASFMHTYPILLDKDGEVNRQYAVSSLPTTFFIGRDGMIRDLVIGGPLTLAGLSNRVEALLQELP